MSTATAAILTNVSSLLQDVAQTRWTPTQLLTWLNEGQREVLLYKANAYVRNTVVSLIAGTKQALPSDGTYLIDIVRNMGTDGISPTRPVRIVSREVLDTQIPDWHNPTRAAALVKNYVYNRENPTVFYVNPPQPVSNNGYVELVYGAIPADATAMGNITLDDIYSIPLTNYVMYRAWSQDAEWANNQLLAMAYYGRFVGLLTAKTASEEVADPGSGMSPLSQSTPGSAK